MAERAGVTVPHVGQVIRADDGSVLLTMDLVAGQSLDEIPADVITDQLARRLWGEVGRLHQARIAHRSLHGRNIMISQNGAALLVDFSFAELAATSRQRAIDVAELLTSLAGEAFAAAHGLALPSQLRHEIRASGGELHEEFLRLLPRRPAPIRIQRWSARRVASSAAVLAAVVLLGFALANVLINDTTQPSALLVTNMGCQALEPLLAEAQSVPTATEVVCIRSLPAGWSLGRVEALRGTSVITLDNDRAGRGALQLTLTGHCAVGRAAAVRTTEPAISRLRALGGGPGLGATWYDVFPGGCVQIALRPATQQAGADVQIALRPATQQAGADQNLAGQVPAIIGYLSRSALRHDLAERSPVIIADATLPQTLEAASLPNAAAMAIVTSDDLANLETGLAVRDQLGDRWNSVPVVLRMFDSPFARSVRHNFGFSAVRSTAALAAPWFVGAALGLDVLSTFYADDKPLLVARLTVSPGGGLNGLAMSQLSARTRVLAIRRAADEQLLEHPPRRGTRFQAGDQAFLIGPYEELLAVLRQDRPAPQHSSPAPGVVRFPGHP
jgi:Trk K+ transport system NAD-binding subunit